MSINYILSNSIQSFKNYWNHLPQNQKVAVSVALAAISLLSLAATCIKYFRVTPKSNLNRQDENVNNLALDILPAKEKVKPVVINQGLALVERKSIEPQVEVEVEVILNFPDGSHYEGNVENEKMHGQGVLTYSNGEKWQGSFENGKPFTGSGVYKFADGRIFDGSLFEGRFKFGMLSDENGKIWKGFFNEQGEPSTGSGFYALKDGSIYEGHLKDGRLNFGKLTNKDGKVWSGFFNEQGEPSTGSGFYALKDGSIYEGQLVEGQFTFGKLTDKDGKVQEGEFKESKLYNGQGYCQLPEGAFEGDFSKGKAWNGKLTYPNGKTWQGLFGENQKPLSGNGYYPLSNGDYFEGEFGGFDKQILEGKLTYANGKTWEGRFSNGIPCFGKGYCVLPNGQEYEGALKFGRPFQPA
jgi:hypothetical protein